MERAQTIGLPDGDPSVAPACGERSRHALDALFLPASVAVYGASGKDGSRLGNVLLRNVATAGFLEVHAVHPEAQLLEGVGAVASLEGPVDLALISVPAGSAVEAVADAARAGCPVGVVLSSGFAEAGPEGARLQEDLVAAAGGMRLVGPNCMGIVSDVGPSWLNASYFWDPPRRRGPIGLVSQSGAFGGMFLAEARRRQLGLARFASVGNAADLSETDVLEWLGEDPSTQVIGMFVEGVRDGGRFVDVATKVASSKPVILLKGAKRSSGRRAAASHTGTLAGEHGVFAAAMRRAGVVEVSDSETFFDGLAVLAGEMGMNAPGVRGELRRAHRAPGRAGPGDLPRQRVAIVTVSGGPGVLAADAAEDAGFEVAPPVGATRRRLSGLVPMFAALGNPFDFTPQCESGNLGLAVEAVFADPTFDSAVLIDCGLDRPELAVAFAAGAVTSGRKVTAFVLDTPKMRAVLDEAGVPCFDSPERAVRALAIGERPAVEPTGTSPTETPPTLAVESAAGETRALSEWESKVLLGVDLPRPSEALTTSVEEAATFALGIVGPVVAKASGVAHKSDAGLVRTGLDRAGLESVWDELAGAGDGTVLVAEQLQADLELVIGGLRDEHFGPVISIGLGGVAAEVLADAAFVLAPPTAADIEVALASLRSARLLNGYRGSPPVDRGDLMQIVAAVSRLLADDVTVVEVDCNPVMVVDGRAFVADALVVKRR